MFLSLHQYQICPEDGIGEPDGADDLAEAIQVAADRAAETRKTWIVWWRGEKLWFCNEYALQEISKIRLEGRRCAHA